MAAPPFQPIAGLSSTLIAQACTTMPGNTV